MNNRLKILVLIKPLDNMPKHKAKIDMIKAFSQFADVQYWHQDGYLPTILKKMQYNPDFIFHYDVAYNHALSPRITGMSEVNIPKGALVIDNHYEKQVRINYFENSKVDLIFSVYKESFLSAFPQYTTKFRWMPWSIDSAEFKDWNMTKDINYLLMGLVYDGTKTWPPQGKYPFREAVLAKMKKINGFVYYPHPDIYEKDPSKLLLIHNFSKIINRSKIFFTCGSKLRYPVQKFFEVPASRTLLLAEPNSDILELGFKDKVNFVACNTNDFYEKANYYLNNETERNRIASNGYQMIHAQHTNSVRASNTIQIIKSYIQNNK